MSPMTVVRSLAGHDKGEWFVVISLDKGFALIANGKSRSLSRPKRKNLRHLAITETLLSEQDLATDRKLRRALREYVARHEKEENDLGKG